MTLESLEMLKDEQLQAVIARAGELLKQHDRERKDKALADARSILASAGLSLKDLGVTGRGGKARDDRPKTRSTQKIATQVRVTESGDT
jgi:hypothetical protein